MKLEEIRKKYGAQVVKHRVYAEDALQIACKAWFDAAFPERKLLLHHSPNEGKLFQKDRDGAKRKAMGVRAGFPDFILLAPTSMYAYLAIELKSPKGRQTANQKAYEEAVKQSGGRYIIIRSLDDFKKEVRNWMFCFEQRRKANASY